MRKKYRLVFGNHVDTHPDDKDKPSSEKRETRYSQGAIVESDQDLTKLNGRAGDAVKFQLIDDGGVGMGPSPYTWDRERGETLEQFNDRMRAIGAEKVPEPSREAHTIPETTAAPVSNDIRKMNIEQLRTLASAEEIDLKGAKTRDDMVKVISVALEQPVGAGK